MAGSSYLNTLLQTLPAEQTRQILEILTDLRNSGGILNPEEFNQKLRELTSVVNQDNRILPTIELLLALPMQLSRSILHNKMLVSAKNDIKSAFVQIDDMGSKLEDHNILFISNMIKDLEQAVNHQKETIKRLKWLAGKDNEFTHAIVDELTSSKSTSKSSVEVKKIYNLYYDDRSNNIQNELFHDFAGNKLILSPKNNTVIYPTSVSHLSDEYSYQTENEVDDPQNKLVNIIDGKRGTFWTRNIYSSEKLPKVTTVMQFNFDMAKDVSYIHVETGTPEPLVVSSIIGISPEGNEINLHSSSTEIDGRIRIDFSNVFVKSIVVFFETTTYKKVDYFVPKDVNILDIFESNDVFSKLLKKEKIGKVVRKVMVSDKLADTLLSPDNAQNQKIEKYNYLFSLDNVWFGNENYEYSGMFVSKPLKIENVGTIGISTDDSISTVDNISDSIEYEITKIDQLPQYRASRIPIPKIGQSSISSERLVFSGQLYDSTVNDLASLRFCPFVSDNWVLGDTEPVKVYRNGIELQLGTDWEFAVMSVDSITGNKLDFKSTFLSLPNFSEWNLLPQKMFIVIKNIDPNATYTADYDIRFSDYPNSNTVWLDSDKESYLVKDKIIFKKPDNLVKSNIYLVIKMRRNLPSKFSTPKLFEYSLLGSSYN